MIELPKPLTPSQAFDRLTHALALALEPDPAHHFYGGLHMALATALSYDKQFERDHTHGRYGHEGLQPT